MTGGLSSSPPSSRRSSNLVSSPVSHGEGRAEFWLKIGIVLLGVRFVLGDIVKLEFVIGFLVISTLDVRQLSQQGWRPLAVGVIGELRSRGYAGDGRRRGKTCRVLRDVLSAVIANGTSRSPFPLRSLVSVGTEAAITPAPGADSAQPANLSH